MRTAAFPPNQEKKVSPSKINIALFGGLMLLLSGTPWAAEQDKKQSESFDQTPVVANQLDTQRGGADTKVNNTLTNITQTNTLNGTVDNNSAINVVSGNNAISGGAFQGTTGFPMVIQNSGSNVLIQNATILNVTVQQP